jgi:hypothetical protein
MDKAEAAGFGVATVGHAALLAVLMLGLASWGGMAPPPPAIEVSFIEDVAAISASPRPSIEPPAQSLAPDPGPPEEAAPAPASEPAPLLPPRPAPSAERARPQPARQPPSTASRPAERPRERTRGARIGDEILKGIGRDPSPSRAQNPPGAVMSAQAAADIGSAILRQIQPCADRQVDPGPGANRIVTTVNLRLNRNGSLAARPRVVSQRGVDDSNSRYADRVADLAIAAFTGCSPLRGLPQELYDVPRGWSNFTMTYRLPD